MLAWEPTTRGRHEWTHRMSNTESISAPTVSPDVTLDPVALVWGTSAACWLAHPPAAGHRVRTPCRPPDDPHVAALCGRLLGMGGYRACVPFRDALTEFVAEMG